MYPKIQESSIEGMPVDSVSLLEKMLGGQNEVIGLLQESIQRLESKLQPLTLPLPTGADNANKEAAKSNSPIVEIIERNTSRINRLCERVNYISETILV